MKNLTEGEDRMKYRKRTWKKYFKKMAQEEHPGMTVKLKRTNRGWWKCIWEDDDCFIYGSFWQSRWY